MYDIVKDVQFERIRMRMRQQKTEDKKKSLQPRKNRSSRNQSQEIIYPNPKRYYEQMILSNVGK